MLFNDMKPFITILAVDPHVIIKGIEHNLQGLFRDSSITGHDYLRNIVHLPFFIQSQVLRPKRRSTEPTTIEYVSSETNAKGIVSVFISSFSYDNFYDRLAMLCFV